MSIWAPCQLIFISAQPATWTINKLIINGANSNPNPRINLVIAWGKLFKPIEIRTISNFANAKYLKESFKYYIMLFLLKRGHINEIHSKKRG